MGSTKFPVVAPPAGGTPSLPGPGQPAPMKPGEFVGASVANRITFQFDNVSPPSALYVQRDDKLNLFFATNVVIGDTVTFEIRFLRVPEPQGGQPSDGGVGRTPGAIFARGIVQAETETLVLANTGSLNRQINMAEGYLLSVGVVATNATVRGRTFARATLIRTTATPFVTSQQLFSDYATNLNAVGWPGGRQLHSTEGPGWLHSLNVANPAAGADFSLVVSAFQRLRIISMEAQLAVANSGAARPVEIIVDDGANIYARMAANIVFPINATTNLNFSNSGTPSTAIASDAYAQMPATLVLPVGHRIRSLTTNIAAADQWSNIWFGVEEWLDVI